MLCCITLKVFETQERTHSLQVIVVVVVEVVVYSAAVELPLMM